jgi:hypothetical protein
MMIMRVHVVELLCQVVMGRVPVLKCLVLGVWVPSATSYRARLFVALLVQGLAVAVFTRYWRAPGCDYRMPGLGYKEDVQLVDMW